jgi:hypothetical protein
LKDSSTPVTCEECKDLNTHEFRSSDDLVYAVQLAATELDRGVLKRVNRAELSVAEQEALYSAVDAGGSPGSVFYEFECTVCGDRFDLSGDPETGTGRWTRTAVS